MVVSLCVILYMHLSMLNLVTLHCWHALDFVHALFRGTCQMTSISKLQGMLASFTLFGHGFETS